MLGGSWLQKSCFITGTQLGIGCSASCRKPAPCCTWIEPLASETLDRHQLLSIQCQQQRRDDVYLVFALCKCLRYVDVSQGVGSLYDSTGPVHELGSSRFFYNAPHLCGRVWTVDTRPAVSGAHVMPVQGRFASNMSTPGTLLIHCRSSMKYWASQNSRRSANVRAMSCQWVNKLHGEICAVEMVYR